MLRFSSILLSFALIFSMLGIPFGSGARAQDVLNERTLACHTIAVPAGDDDATGTASH